MQPENRDYREIDQQFADFICRLAGGRGEPLRRSALALSSAVGQGHICLPLADLGIGEEGAAGLRESGVVGAPGKRAPLVLDDRNRLYLYRYWQYEQSLAADLRRRAAARSPVDIPLLRDGIGRLFGPGDGGGTDWQRVAAAAALRSGLAVISGGPGTGKTSTVVKILALLLEQAGGAGLSIALAAPTGKAAARLRESILGARERLGDSTAVAGVIPDQVSTLHRLLGGIPGSSRFRHHRGNPLPHQVVVVDEASMVALPLLAKLSDALRPDARLILLGDRDQLSSVEAGAVLGDICDSGRAHRFSPEFCSYIADATGELLEPGGEGEQPELADSLVILARNYRFGAGSGIGAVSRLVNNGEGEEAVAALAGELLAGVSLREAPPPAGLEKGLAPAVLAGYSGFLALDDPAAALAAFDRFRVLCALRSGPWGVAGLNQTIERILAVAGLIIPDRTWYRGRPVMISVNDYPLRLFNGDIGITLPDPENPGSLAVFFPAPEGGVRRISPQRLPAHETVFAMTVHKSQGSEFERILFLLPDREVEVLTRELLYTAITRAREGVEIRGGGALFAGAAARRTRRSSGLRDALWGGDVSGV